MTTPGSNAWTKLAGVQRLEIEDPESTQSTIPKQVVTALRSLESLSITWTKIKSLPSSLFRLPLNSLYLQRNQIKAINGIEKASGLTILDISNNCLNDLPRTFGLLQSLVNLNLSGNGLHELPDSIGSLSQLKTLDCSCNKLRSLPNSVGNLIELSSLDVGTNQLTSLPESIGSLPMLENLRVTSNQLTSLPDSIGQLNRLSSLLVRNNKFTDVPAQLSRLSSLQKLNLCDNLITHMDRPISSLKYLILDQNQLKQIDVGILQCSNLRYLSLKSNGIVEVTGTIGRLVNIRSLNLSDNAITEVPAELGRLTQLRHLSLCSTKIRTVPLCVACMPTLKTLELDSCKELYNYLAIAYKDSGLSGVVQYLQKEVDSVQNEVGNVGNDSVLRESSMRKKQGNSIESLFPQNYANSVPQDNPDDAVSENPGENDPEICDVARKSIMPEMSVTPPAAEAMLQVEVDRDASPPQPVDLVGQSLVSATKPDKPHKPPDLASRRPDQSRSDQSKTGGTESTSPANQPETVVESTGTDVVATIPELGDLTSTETAQDQQRSSDDARQTASQPGTVDHAVFEDPPVVDSSATGASATRSTKPRPPVKKKPSRIAT